MELLQKLRRQRSLYMTNVCMLTLRMFGCHNLPACMCKQVHLEGGKLRIDQEGRSRKFTKKVQQKTFAASSANGRPILYVTERAVFKLVEGKGLELVEVAPGMWMLTPILGMHCTRPCQRPDLPKQYKLAQLSVVCVHAMVTV